MEGDRELRDESARAMSVEEIYLLERRRLYQNIAQGLIDLTGSIREANVKYEKILDANFDVETVELARRWNSLQASLSADDSLHYKALNQGAADEIAAVSNREEDDAMDIDEPIPTRSRR